MKRHPAITKICLYCEHAAFKQCGDAPSYKNVIGSDELREIVCSYRGTVEPSHTCRRFSFDPLKYTPKKPRPLPTLSEEDVIV
jgi:hypothetical protein